METKRNLLMLAFGHCPRIFTSEVLFGYTLKSDNLAFAEMFISQ